MTDDLGVVRAELGATTGRLLDDRASTARVRELLDDKVGFDETLWKTFAELGLLGLEIPEELGGAGMSMEETAVVLVELGRRVMPLPVLSTLVLGVGALRAVGSPSQRAEWLPGVADGARRLAVALGDPTGIDTCVPGVTAVSHGSGYRLDGEVRFVADAATADALIVVAESAEGPSLFLLGADSAGLTVAATPTHDQTRRLGDLALDGVLADRAAVLGEPGAAEATIDWLVDRAATALALDAVGGSDRVLEMSVAYARERAQFGRAIGSFQSVKHRCADMLVDVETARVAAAAAVRAMPRFPGGSRSPWPSIAKAHATDAYVRVASNAIRVHGGIGYTWEHDLHLYLKRAWLDAALLGGPAWHYERLVDFALVGRRN